MFNFSNKRVGGIRFIRLGRLQLSFCVVRADRFAIRQIGLRAVAAELNAVAATLNGRV
jgi:hypothetical protein